MLAASLHAALCTVVVLHQHSVTCRHVIDCSSLCVLLQLTGEDPDRFADPEEEEDTPDASHS